MDWITNNATWVATGLFLFFGVFVIAFFVRNHSAKTDERDTQEKQFENPTGEIKNSRK